MRTFQEVRNEEKASTSDNSKNTKLGTWCSHHYLLLIQFAEGHIDLVIVQYDVAYYNNYR
jgi:hypothetical protein